MTDKTQTEAHSCINPQCNPAKCSGCACAIPPSDEAGHVVLSLLNAFAVNDLGHPFEDGDSAVVDRARQWLQNRSTALQAAPPAPAAVAVPAPIAAGMKAAADLVQEQADLYIAEHAETDPDTGAVIWHHRDYGFDWHNGLEELAQKLLARAAVAAAPAQAAAWMTPEGDRVVTEATMASARKDGGAMLSSLRPFTVALARVAAPAQAVAVPIELQGVKEAVEQGSGFWRSCTGCHELNEGHATGPVSKVFGCALGNGCSECGGIGAVWDDIDYGAMADAMAAPAQEHATQLAGQGRGKCVCTFAQRVVGDGCRDCNPQEYIDRLHKCLDDYREEADTPAQAPEDALDAAELREIQRAAEQFADCGETDVDYALLMRAAQAGYLECTHFQVMNESALNLDAARAAQGGAA